MKQIFLKSQLRYGARKIKQCLATDGNILSRRRIRRIMKRLNLVFVYQQASFKPHSKGKNEAPIPNRLARQFNQEKRLEAIVTDLTYVRVGKRWAYVCLIMDLYNREIIGLSVGWQKPEEARQASDSEYPLCFNQGQFFPF